MVNAKVKAGSWKDLDESEGKACAKLAGDGEAIRLLQSNLHAARRAIVAHPDSDSAEFQVKASPSELHVVRDD